MSLSGRPAAARIFACLGSAALLINAQFGNICLQGCTRPGQRPGQHAGGEGTEVNFALGCQESENLKVQTRMPLDSRECQHRSESF